MIAFLVPGGCWCAVSFSFLFFASLHFFFANISSHCVHIYLLLLVVVVGIVVAVVVSSVQLDLPINEKTWRGKKGEESKKRPLKKNKQTAPTGIHNPPFDDSLWCLSVCQCSLVNCSSSSSEQTHSNCRPIDYCLLCFCCCQVLKRQKPMAS